MSLMSIVKARIRGTVAAYFSEGDEQQSLQMNNRGDLVVVQGLPELTDLVRLGDSWQVSLATGLAALTVLPTTVAGLSLWNGEPDTGKSYAIDSFGSAEEVIDATQADTTAIFACLNAGKVASPTAAAVTVRSLSARKYGGNAIVASGATIANDGWFPHGAEAQSPLAPAVAGANWKVNEAKVRGLYYVPPGCMFNIQAVKAGAAAAAQQFFFVRFHQVKLAFGS